MVRMDVERAGGHRSYVHGLTSTAQPAPSAAQARVATASEQVLNPASRAARRAATGERCAGSSDEKGYGRLTADDGEVLCFHHSAIRVDGYAALTEGQHLAACGLTARTAPR